MPVHDLAPPGVEPLTLAYTKTFLRVDHDAEDEVITDMIISARQRVETLIRASLIARRQIYTTDKLSDSGLIINHGPVTVAHSVKLIGIDSEIDVMPLDYKTDLRAIPARICLTSPRRWRDYAPGPIHAEVEMDAGYGSAASDVPMPLRQAMMLLIAQNYEHRGRAETPPVPMMVDALLMPYRSLKL